jgi:chromosome segregation ATPase
VLNEKQFRQKIVKLEKELKEKNLHSNEEIDSLQTQLKILQKQFDQLKIEHSKTIEKFDQNKNQINENEQHLQDEIQRLRRDLGLELYRKQDAEKKARSFEDKLRYEQTQLQKVQYDYTQTKHDLKTLQVKYDALQLELIEMHKNAKTNPNLEIKTPSTIVNRGKRRTNDESELEQEAKKPKRVTRSSSNNSSLNTYEQENGKRPKRNGSTASASNKIPIPIKQTKKKSSNVKFNFLIEEEFISFI